MDEVIARSRYLRQNAAYGRRKKRNVRESTLALKIGRQAAICILILVAVGIVKSTGTPVTKMLSQKMHDTVLTDYDISAVIPNLDDFLNGSFDSFLPDVQEAGNEDVDNVPAEEDYDSAVNSVKTQNEFIAPVVGGIVTDVFGDRLHPIKQVNEFHNGIDISATQGAEIKAALSGIVKEAGNDPSYGKFIKLDHENGLITVYAHCSELLVEAGEKVDQSMTIAKVGSTGASVGAHLHFEVWKGDMALDPTNFIDVPKIKTEQE